MKEFLGVAVLVAAFLVIVAAISLGLFNEIEGMLP
jgi:hypothetical protein